MAAAAGPEAAQAEDALKRSFMEVYSDAVEVHRAYERHRKKQKTEPTDKEAGSGEAAEDGEPGTQPKRSQTFEKEYRKWFDKTFKSKFASYEMLSDTRESRNKLKAAGLWEWYSEYCGRHCVFSDGDLDNRTVVLLNNELSKVLGKSARWVPVLKASLKLAIPTNDGVPWLLRTKSDVKRLSLLVAPLKESKDFQRSVKPTTPVSQCITLGGGGGANG